MEYTTIKLRGFCRIAAMS